MNEKIAGFYFITDSRLSKNGIVKDAQDAVQGGSRIIQYRAKGALFTETWKHSKELLAITQKTGALLIINDYPVICQKTGADGVHLGQSDDKLRDTRVILGSKIIGVSVASVARASVAAVATRSTASRTRSRSKADSTSSAAASPWPSATSLPPVRTGSEAPTH